MTVDPTTPREAVAHIVEQACNEYEEAEYASQRRPVVEAATTRLLALLNPQEGAEGDIYSITLNEHDTLWMAKTAYEASPSGRKWEDCDKGHQLHFRRMIAAVFVEAMRRQGLTDTQAQERLSSGYEHPLGAQDGPASSAPSPIPAHAGLVSEAHQMSLTLRGLETHDAERTWALSSKVQFLLTRLANALESIK